MTENQELRKYLVEKNEYNVERAKEAYDFIIGNETEAIKYHKDGVYLRYEDGHEEWFNGKNKKENVVGVAIHLGERHTCIAKFDVEDDDDEFVKEFPLLMNNNNDTEEDKKAFITSNFDAYNDLDGKKHTESLMRRGCKIPLAENQYIPSQGEWLLVLMFFKRVQEALDYVCGEMLKSAWYWSSTEYTSYYAWYASCGGGSICNFYRKHRASRVRPCLK